MKIKKKINFSLIQKNINIKIYIIININKLILDKREIKNVVNLIFILEIKNLLLLKISNLNQIEI
jgi:hypothetical protein